MGFLSDIYCKSPLTAAAALSGPRRAASIGSHDAALSLKCIFHRPCWLPLCPPAEDLRDLHSFCRTEARHTKPDTQIQKLFFLKKCYLLSLRASSGGRGIRSRPSCFSSLRLSMRTPPSPTSKRGTTQKELLGSNESGTLREKETLSTLRNHSWGLTRPTDPRLYLLPQTRRGF